LNRNLLAAGGDDDDDDVSPFLATTGGCVDAFLSPAVVVVVTVFCDVNGAAEEAELPDLTEVDWKRKVDRSLRFKANFVKRSNGFSKR